MKENLFKTWRSGITVLLVLCMVVGLMAPAVSAAQVSDVYDDGAEFKDTILAAIEERAEEEDIDLEELKTNIEIAYELVIEYYDEAYAYAYDYAEENGYIAEAVESIDKAIAALKAVEAVPGTDAFQAKAAAAIAEAIETLEAAKVLVLEADVLDQASLDALLALLNESADAMYRSIDALVQAGVDVNQLAIIPALKVAHAALLNEVIPAIVKNLEEAVEVGTEYLIDKLEGAYEALVDAAIAAVKKYAPMVDEALYDYFYNNPEEVIDFFKTYGPLMLDLADEYGDEVLTIVFYALPICGDDIAAYIIENPKAVIAAVTKWWNTYGDRIIAITQVYAEALGLCDAVREQVAELEAKLNAAITELIVLKAELEAMAAKLEAKIAELEAKINAEIEAEIAKIKAEIAKIEAEIAKIKAEIAKVEGEIENITDALAAIDGQIAAAVEAIVAAFEGAYLNATTADYEIDKDSYYVALGDGSAASMSYVDALAAELGIDYKNLADAALTIDDVLATIEANAADIAAADLITIGYGNTAFTHDAVAQMMAVLSGEAAKEYDWAALVGEEGVPYVEMILAEVYAYIIENGMDMDLGGISVADVLMAAVEAYAYGAVSYTVNLPKAVEAIRDINSDAVVIIVGMHNAFRGTVLEFEGETIDFSSILDKFVDVANIYGTALCMITGDAIFVEAPEVETGVSDQTIGVLEFLMGYIMDPSVLDATANGHEYVKTQILDALNVTVAGLLGDVDGNGVVNSKDAMLVAQYYAGVITEVPAA